MSPYVPRRKHKPPLGNYPWGSYWHLNTPEARQAFKVIFLHNVKTIEDLEKWVGPIQWRCFTMQMQRHVKNHVCRGFDWTKEGKETPEGRAIWKTFQEKLKKQRLLWNRGKLKETFQPKDIRIYPKKRKEYGLFAPKKKIILELALQNLDEEEIAGALNVDKSIVAAQITTEVLDKHKKDKKARLAAQIELVEGVASDAFGIMIRSYDKDAAPKEAKSYYAWAVHTMKELRERLENEQVSGGEEAKETDEWGARHAAIERAKLV